MRIKTGTRGLRVATLAAVSCVLALGPACSSESNSLPATGATGTTSPPATAAVRGFAYVSDRSDGLIHAYEVRGTAQAFVQLQSVPTDLPEELAASPSKRFLYVSTQRGVAGFTLGPDGRLTQSTFAPDAHAPLVVDPLERFLFAAGDHGAAIETWGIDGSSGALTKLATYPVPGSVKGLIVDPTGTMAVVATRWGGPLQVLGVDPVLGTLSPQGAFVVSGAAHKLLLAPSGRHLHVWTDASLLETLAIDAGTLTLSLVGPPVSLSADTYDVVAVGADLFTSRLDLATQTPRALTRYSVDPGTGAVSLLSVVASSPVGANGLVGAPGELYLNGGYDVRVAQITRGELAPSGSLVAYATSQAPPRPIQFVWR